LDYQMFNPEMEFLKQTHYYFWYCCCY